MKSYHQVTRHLADLLWCTMRLLSGVLKRQQFEMGSSGSRLWESARRFSPWSYLLPLLVLTSGVSVLRTWLQPAWRSAMWRPCPLHRLVCSVGALRTAWKLNFKTLCHNTMEHFLFLFLLDKNLSFLTRKSQWRKYLKRQCLGGKHSSKCIQI